MELLDRLVKFATLRPRSEFEIKRWLIRKKISEKDSSVALTELKKAGLIDDAAFVRWWIDQRTTFRPKSQRMLLVELVKKGVDKELAKQELASSGLPRDEELARLVIEKRKRTLERFDLETRKKKIINLLASRGFSWGVIKGILD
ncbi:regulatory protein RecX [Candidatus Microgenomates bacterium]|nr:regulatory protein RecX [Candidatus Microgenomates bacterium]